MQMCSEDIKDMLLSASSASDGLGLTFKTNLFIGREPSSPDDCVTIYDTPSFPPDRALGLTEVYYYSAIQIRVRYLDYAAGMDLARNIMTSLCERAHESWNDTLYTVITATGEPALLAWDDNNRSINITNYSLQRRPV